MTTIGDFTARRYVNCAGESSCTNSWKSRYRNDFVSVVEMDNIDAVEDTVEPDVVDNGDEDADDANNSAPMAMDDGADGSLKTDGI